MLGALAWPKGRRSNAGDKLERRRASAIAELRPGRRERTRGGGGSVRGLTAEPASARARSGMPGSSRIAGEEPRRPESNLATATAPRGTPACVARRGGSWRRGGAPGHDGEARGRRWLWPRRAAATAALRARGEGEMQGRERNERAREGSGRCWALLARPGRRGERAGRQLPWRACARRAATTRPVPLAQGGGRLASASRLG